MYCICSDYAPVSEFATTITLCQKQTMRNRRIIHRAILTLTATTLTLGRNVNSFVPATLGRRSLFSLEMRTSRNIHFVANSRSSDSSSVRSAPFWNSRTIRARTQMLFGNFFQNFNTGFVEAVIDYDTLDHPGPELARAAIESPLENPLIQSTQDPHISIATFAGGCFWGMELAFQRVPGVVYTTVGYTQGREEYPTYGQVSVEATGHTEAVCVYYNASECTYEDLLDLFFERVNPLTVNGQGRDYGKQYRTGVYYHTPEQENIARARFEHEQRTKYPNKAIATELKASLAFWPAEKYHQQYLSKGGPRRVAQNAEKGCKDTIRCYG